MKRTLITGLALLVHICIIAHPWRPSHYVIVDTDGGVDDIKAISMLLASPDVRVLALTVSPGVLSADNAYIKVRSLLDSYRHEGIPVGINRTSKYRSNEFPVALNAVWGEEKGIDPRTAPDFLKLIEEILSAERTKITFICLGSMSTAHLAAGNLRIFREQVRNIIWSADGSSDTGGFNYNISKDASILMLRQEIPVNIVRRAELRNEDFYNTELIEAIGNINTPYGKKLHSFLKSDIAARHKYSFGGVDDMIPLFLHYPDLFINKVAGTISDSSPADLPGLREAVVRILRRETVAENQVIKSLPSDPSFYFDDLQPFVTRIIERYGREEFFAGVIANELHRHLGVYAIIGVKMGIRAREYFNTGVDEFHATSYAGSTPPLSCMNDGIQVSTGATPGHGLLTVRNDTILKPVVDFDYLNTRIRVSLKPEIAEKIGSELKEINFVYGLDSNIYWELVRRNAIRYWLDLSRHEIFDIERID